MRRIVPLLLVILGLSVSIAKADMTYIGSQAGFCCFNVNLQDFTDKVQVTVTLTSGAQYFVGTGGPHPGFAFNLSGAPVSATDINPISSAWTQSEFHATAASSPGLGTFDYFFDNPGSGASAHNAGPLVFTINRTGITDADFVANTDGFFFAADIMNAAGATGESGINRAPHVPEPGSILLLGILLGLGTLAERKLGKRI